MATSTLEEQLNAYLTDAHSIEVQALAQMRSAPGIAVAPELVDAFTRHLGETERHERLVRERLEARGASPSRLKDAAMAAGGKGFVLFARSQTDTPGKLAAHGYSYEALELASYDLLCRVAERAGDEDTAAAARTIRSEEEAMRSRIAASWDAAVDASLQEASGDDLRAHLVRYLADAHALEGQAEQLLSKAVGVAGDPELAQAYEHHLGETREHERRVRERLEAYDEGPSRLKDAALSLGGLNWSMFFGVQPDTPGKLAAFAFAFEHLEIAGYEQLLRVARRLGDEATVAAAESILAEERSAAEQVAAHFDRAAAASLAAQGVEV